MIVQLEDKLVEAHQCIEQNLCDARKCIHYLQSDMEQLRLSVKGIEHDFDAQSTRLDDKLAELLSALDTTHDDCNQLRHRVAELETGNVRVNG